MLLPGQRIIHPEFGDVTADIIEELLEQARLKDPVILEREQAEIAAASGCLARDLSCGRLVAEIHEDIFDAWGQKEGYEFFTKGDGVKYLNKHFPATRVVSKSRQPKILVDGFRKPPTTPSRGGRWHRAA